MIHKTFATEGNPDISVSIESGRVEVQEGPPGAVDVMVETRIPDFIVEQRGNSILISSNKSGSWLPRDSTSVVIGAPAGSDLKVSVASAEVRAGLDLGRVDIKTASGDIDIARADTLVVKTASGDLDVESVERGLRFSSASGDARAGRVGGTLVASTASGDVRVDESDATVDVSSASGDIAIRRFTGRSANFKTMSGEVELGIPRGTDVELDANLLSGKLRVPDSEPRQGPVERHMAIKARLVSGDLTIDRA